MQFRAYVKKSPMLHCFGAKGGGFAVEKGNIKIDSLPQEKYNIKSILDKKIICMKSIQTGHF